jgi:hypothetical protein
MLKYADPPAGGISKSASPAEPMIVVIPDLKIAETVMVTVTISPGAACAGSTDRMQVPV